MGIFSKSKTPTKMFVSQISAPKPKGELFQKKSIEGIRTTVTHTVSEIAPELIKEGFKLLSSTIAGFTEDYTLTTVVHKNIDGNISNSIFIPSQIRIIRADFSRDNMCHDNFIEHREECHDLENRKLHIELDIIKSKDMQTFYFQPSYYYYIGVDNRDKKIDKINLSFAFVEASENISDYKSVNFKNIISFRDLDSGVEHIFKREDGTYDTTFQSPWISSELSKKGAYTIVIKIEEKRYSKHFAKTLNKIYKNHENELKNRINQEIKEQLSKIGRKK
jgi:hypothetical protein